MQSERIGAINAISLLIVRIKYFNGWKTLRIMFEMHCILIVNAQHTCTLVILLPFSLINSSLKNKKIKIINSSLIKKKQLNTYHVCITKQHY